MRKTASILGVVVVLALVLALSPATVIAGGSDDGATLFAGKCASCHSKDGSGTSAMGKKLALRDLGSPEVQKQTDAELTTITTKGKGKMPAYEKKLSADEIKLLVAHIRTFAKK